MLRRTDQVSYRALIAMARAAIPNVALSTDVIVGFPGESDDEFAISEAFIAEMDFMKLHVFPYSARPGTAAERMRNHVDVALRKTRAERLRAISEAGDRRYRERLSGRVSDVLWENVIGASEQGWLNSGLNGYYVRVYWTGPRVLTNTLTPALLGGLERDGLSIRNFV